MNQQIVTMILLVFLGKMRPLFITRTRFLRKYVNGFCCLCLLFYALFLDFFGNVRQKRKTNYGKMFSSPIPQFFHLTCPKPFSMLCTSNYEHFAHDDNKTINFKALNVPFGNSAYSIHDMLLAFSHIASHTRILILLSFSCHLFRNRHTIFVQSTLNRFYSLTA